MAAAQQQQQLRVVQLVVILLMATHMDDVLMVVMGQRPGDSTQCSLYAPPYNVCAKLIADNFSEDYDVSLTGHTVLEVDLFNCRAQVRNNQDDEVTVAGADVAYYLEALLQNCIGRNFYGNYYTPSYPGVTIYLGWTYD